MTFQTLTVAGAHSGGPCLACGRIGVYVKKAKDKFDLAAGWYCDRSPEGLKCREAQIAHYAQTHRNSVCKTAPTRTSIDRLNDGSPKAPAGSSDTLDHTATEPTRTSIDRLNDGGPKASDSGSGNTKAEEETQVAGQSACNLTLQEMFDQGFLSETEYRQATALHDAQARLNEDAQHQVACRLCKFKGPQNQFEKLDKPDKAEEGPESSEWQCKNSRKCAAQVDKNARCLPKWVTKCSGIVFMFGGIPLAVEGLSELLKHHDKQLTLGICLLVGGILLWIWGIHCISPLKVKKCFTCGT